MKRPSKKKIEAVVTWLASIDIKLYGPCMNTRTGEEQGSLMDYDVDAALKRYAHIKLGSLIEFEP